MQKQGRWRHTDFEKGKKLLLKIVFHPGIQEKIAVLFRTRSEGPLFIITSLLFLDMYLRAIRGLTRTGILL